MAIFKCKMCGATLGIVDDKRVIECDYCGTKQTVPIIKTKEIEELYDRANYFFHNNEYDKAADIYENISTENPYDPESYFMLALCKYGIEYVDDSISKKKIPTLHRLHYESITNDINYKKAIKNADSSQKILYEQEAKYIDEVRGKILSISKKEKPYDVFICYKETDEKGQRTEDSVIAMDIYNELTKEGLKVFFARITLESKLGVDYEPYIFAALNSAKVMIVVGTKPEYINSPWVRNEWSRFLDRIKNNKSNKKNAEQCYIVPAYKGMSPYALPNEFSSVQAQDMSKVGATQDLVHGVKKLLIRSEINESADNKSKMNNWVKAIIGLIVIVILGIVLVVNMNKIKTENNTIIIRDNQYVMNKDYETIIFEGISDFGENDISQLNKLKSIKELSFTNCILENLDFAYELQNVKGLKFDAKTSIINLNISNYCENIESFNYDYTSNSLPWNDLSFLSKFPNLISLCVPICDDLTSLSNLNKLEKIELRSQKNSIIKNFKWCVGLERVTNLKITTAISRTKFIGDDYFSGIENLKNIEELYLVGTIGANEEYGYIKQNDIDYISELSKLKKIYINYYGSISNYKKISLKSFQKLKNLEYIHITSKNTFDLSDLNNMDNLSEIVFYTNCHICNNDLTCISNCKNLEYLKIYVSDWERIYDSNGNDTGKSILHDEHNRKKFSLKGIENLSKLKVLNIRIDKWFKSSTQEYVPHIEILNEELAKNIQYSIE